MTRAALVAVLLLLAGCAQQHEISPLQRYDALRPKLRSVTTLAATVSADLNQINQGMKHDNRRWIKRVATRLDRDAARLGRAAGGVHAQVAAIRRDDGGAVRRYFGLILTAVSRQRFEAVWAGRLSKTLQRDPLLASPRNYAIALRQSRLAARSAGASVELAAAARSLEAKNRLSFRYVRVASSSSKG